ncbi:MAG: 30S ribosomal protein S1 [Bacteroidetes bacterium]|nr:30S ribosomal protein S1 [Bacteroidota bacterium]
MSEETKQGAASQPEFDWSTVSKRGQNYSKEEQASLSSMYEQTLSSVAEHEILDGKVVHLTPKDVVVNIGYKSEGVVPRTEFRYNAGLAVGDMVEVYIDQLEDRNGQLLLSHRKARAIRAWDRVNEVHAKDEVITGVIKCRTKGGLIADVFGIEAFLPGSQIDVKPIRDYDIYVGKTMEFKVVKINQEFKNVVVSHKILLEEELEEQKKHIISKLEKGQVLEGIVKNITSYGVFVDLGGVDGLIHITDISWGRINHPEEVVNLDEKINVVVLDYDDEKRRIALGLKQLSAHPWEALSAELKDGDKVKGKVVVLADYGAFVEIAPGVEGLIHVSEMSWSQHLRTAHDFLKIGDEVEAVVLSIDREERKMSLGMKQLTTDPWENIEGKYPQGSRHTAVVRNFTNYGIFVELEEGIDGLIHISDLSWTKKIKHPSDFTKIGEKIEVSVLEIDTTNRKLSLGHKQLEEDPWEVFATVFNADEKHKGTVLELNDKGGIIALPYGIEGFAPMKHLKKEDGSKASVDEQLDFSILEFSKDDKKILVSHTRTWDESKPEVGSEPRPKASGKSKAPASTSKVQKADVTTLGDISALSDLKKEMEATEKESAKPKSKAKSKKADAASDESAE